MLFTAQSRIPTPKAFLKLEVHLRSSAHLKLLPWMLCRRCGHFLTCSSDADQNPTPPAEWSPTSCDVTSKERTLDDASRCFALGVPICPHLSVRPPVSAHRRPPNPGRARSAKSGHSIVIPGFNRQAPGTENACSAAMFGHQVPRSMSTHSTSVGQYSGIIFLVPGDLCVVCLR